MTFLAPTADAIREAARLEEWLKDYQVSCPEWADPGVNRAPTAGGGFVFEEDSAIVEVMPDGRIEIRWREAAR